MNNDPVDSGDPAELRRQLLSARDRLAVADAQREVASSTISHRDQLIAELSARLTEAESQVTKLQSARATPASRRAWFRRGIRSSIKSRFGLRRLRRRGVLR